MSLPAQIHPRMPVILISFDDQSRLVNVKELLIPYPADQMRMWKISPRVNSAGE
jgi:putative SOS response-associated peptidase YedK